MVLGISMNSSKEYCLKKLFYPVVLYLIAVMLLSCTAKRIEIQYYEGSLNDRLKSLEYIQSIKSVFSVELDRGDNVTIKGEGILRLSGEDLALQVYSMGFIVAEVNADGSSVRSDPPISKNRLLMLVDGLRNSFFWWDMKEYSFKDEGDNFILTNSWKRLIIDKKTMMPLRLKIDLEDGNRLDISYYEPTDINGFVFPSKIRIELLNYAVNLKIKDMEIKE